MQTLRLKAPAKVNLYLNVLNRRPDGFHNIETIFEKIDLCDEITLRRRKRGIKLLCQQKDLPRDKKNLAYQAAEVLLKRATGAGGVEIRISKKIPLAAGLGGGSSDAACVLLGLNKLLACNLGQRQLHQMAQKLGADVPFFLLRQSRAIGRGKGEKLSPLRLRRRNWYVLVIPRLRVSSRKMYQALKIALTKPPFNVKIILHALEEGNLSSLNKNTYNSFEPILIKKYKQVLEIKKALESSGACATLMSGSGPCVFGIAKTGKEAVDISEKLKGRGRDWQVIIAKTYTNAKSQKLR